MDFDEYMATVLKVGAEPYVVVGYDSVKRAQRTEDDYLADAVAWVRYAKSKGYKVRYWEIGNENWHNETVTPEEMARVAKRFSAGMKAEDPSIKVGASGNSTDWWDRFLPGAAASLDFLSVSNYPAWDFKSYDRYYQSPHVDLLGSVRSTVESIRKHSHSRPLPVLVVETNSKDFAPNGWPDANSMGHALVTFELFAGCAMLPGVDAALLWTTRWMEEEKVEDSVWYALGPKNETMPTGRAVELWGKYALPNLVRVSGSTDIVGAYATMSSPGTAGVPPASGVLWIVNRGKESVDLSVGIGIGRMTGASVRTFAGSGSDDRSPKISPPSKVSVQAGKLELRGLPLISISVVEFKTRR
jgi:hypothetical protein